MENQEEELHHSHDKLFKMAFQQKQTVVDFLTHFFPPELTAHINLDKLRLDPTNYISRKMDEFFSDIVYRTTWKNTRKPLAIALLFEHKKTPSSRIYLQFLEYQLGIWHADIAHKRALTIVIPIVIYQGKRGWSKKTFPQYFKDLPDLLQRFIPNFDYHLMAIAELDGGKILSFSDASLLRTLLLTYKYLDDTAFVESHFAEFFDFFKEHPELEALLHIFVEYFFKNSGIDEETLKDLVAEFLDSQLKPKVMSTYEQLIRKGRIEGKIEGKIEGEIQGEIKGRTEMLRNAWRKGYSISQMADLAGWSVDEIKKLVEQFEKEN